MIARGVVFTAPEQVAVRDVRLPEVGPEDVLIRTLYSGISIGTEGWILKNRYKGVTYPLVSGYQFCGTVEQAGADAGGFKEGDVVFARSTRLAGDEVRPMWAGHVSRAVVAAKQVYRVPQGVSPAAASLAVMPAVPWHGIQLTGIEPGDLVVVVGMGQVGQYAAQLARLKGARVIAVETLVDRLELAARYSADIALNPERDDVAAAVAAEKEAGADVIIDTSANVRAVNASFEWARRNARYCLQGYYPDTTSLDLYTPHVKQLTFYNPTDCEGIDTMLQYMAEGRLNVADLITHTLPAERAAEAFDIAMNRPREAVAMVLQW
ncbi:MAG: zinc-dependent alcohol dehydrogenase [Anaerolineae bacterium]